MTKAQRIAEYNLANKGYDITNIKKLPKSYIDYARVNGHKSLFECYTKPSDTKIETYRDILELYKPEIIEVNGGSNFYSVLLKAENGDILHITKANNYLVEVTE